MILTAILSGCKTESYNKRPVINLPEMPIAGKEVASELSLNCNQEKCPKTNNWLNELYLFKAKYSIYKEELKK